MTERKRSDPLSDGNGSNAAQRIQWMVGIITAIVLAGIPWAFSLHGKVSSMDTRLTTLEQQISSLKVPPDWFKDQVDKNTKDIDAIKGHLRMQGP